MNITPRTFFHDWLASQWATAKVAVPDAAALSLSAHATIGDEAFSVRVEGGQLTTVSGPAAADALLSLRATRRTFDALVGQAMGASAEAEPIVLQRLIALDEEARQLLRGLPGGLALEVSGPESYRVEVLPGTGQLEAACVVRCGLDAIEELRQGKTHPLELLMNGRLELDGDVQIAMGLAGLLMGP